MQNYIRQLLADIETARQNLPQLWQEREVDICDWLSQKEDEQQAPRKTVAEWTGIKQEQLPPAERLTPEQIQLLFQALSRLLDDLNCSFVVQIQVPEEVQYRTLRQMWQQEHAWLQWHQNFFDFCKKGQEHGTCAMGAVYCHCKFYAEFFSGFEDADEEWTEEDEERFWEDYERRKRQQRWDDWF